MIQLRSIWRKVVGGPASLLLASALIPYAAAQTVTTGEVAGVTTDATGAVVVGATITLKSLDTGEARTALSNAAGLYRFTFIRPGAYDASASSAGLASDVARAVVGLGHVQTLNLLMRVAEARRVVEVHDIAPLLDADNAQTAYTMTERQIEMLPLPGGDLLGVAYSVPGVVIANRYGTNGNFSLQGIGGVSNLFTVNGADDMDPYWNLNNSGTSALLLGMNEIQQASVIQNAYEGQYGRQAGAQLNYVTKSGTNQYHGKVSYDYNGSVLNANDYFNNASGVKRPHLVSNQYAASFGGPVVRNKLFFFADTEGLRYAHPVNTSVLAVPSKALEQYTLASLQPSQAALYRQAFTLYDAAPGRSAAVAVSNGKGLLQDASGHLGCGKLAGTPTGFGGAFGTDVSCADAYARSIPRQTSEWLLSSRVDYNVSARQRLFLRVRADHGFNLDRPSAISPIFNIASRRPSYETQVNHTFTITPRLTNNFTGAVSYYSYQPKADDLQNVLSTFPQRWNIGNGGANGSHGLTSMGAVPILPTGNHRSGNVQIVNDVSYSAGNHWLKAGVNYRFTREVDLQYQSLTSIGRFTFTGLDDFAHGLLNPKHGSFFDRFFPQVPVLHINLYTLGFYAQDEWAVTPRLKLTGTLRFDRNGNPDCVDRCFSRLVAPFALMAKGASIPYDQSIQAGVAHPFYRVDAIAVEPRFSFAYNPSWSQSTVIRGGVGLFSDFFPTFFASQLAGNPPSRFYAAVRQGLVNAGGAGSAPALAEASAAAFQNGFATGATLGELQKAVSPASFAPPYYSVMPSMLHTPKFAEWSLEVQHQLGSKNVASLAYRGSHGYDLFLTNSYANAAVNTDSYPNGFGSLPMATPDPRFGTVDQLTNAARSNYNGMTASLRRSFGSGLQGQISYTWSHSLDSVSNGGLLGFSYDSFLGAMDPVASSALNYSHSDYDVRHNFTLDFVWNVPVRPSNPLLKAVLGGWSIAGRANAYTGTPFTVYNSDLAGSFATNVGGYAILAAVADPHIRTTCGHAATQTPCFVASQFVGTDTQTTFGNVPRNFFRGPGYFDVDSSLYKTIALGDRTRFTFGASAFNLFNHANLADPSGDVADPGLGLITFTGSSPSSPYGMYGGPAGRVVVVRSALSF